MDFTFELRIETKNFELNKVKKLLNYLDRDDFVESYANQEQVSTEEITVLSVFDEQKELLEYIEAKIHQEFEARTEIRKYPSQLWKEAWEDDFKAPESSYFAFCDEELDQDSSEIMKTKGSELPSSLGRIYLRGNQAFGRGDHATTKALLLLLEKTLIPEESLVQSFLDVGCGTGIFAIWAEKFGFRHVVATDTDPIAIDATKKNRQRNSCTFEVYETPIPPPDNYDVIVSNILPPTLNMLFPIFKERLAKKGSLFLSGFNEANFVDVESDWIRNEFTTAEVLNERGWTAVLLKHL